MHEEISEEHIFMIEKQVITLKDFDAPGYILDIGGGGEGIIGILKQNVIAIDKRKDELEEAPDGPLKIVMDARELQFLDNVFETVTAFFTFMYIKSPDRAKVFEEIYRVLNPGGSVLIWDVVIPPRRDNTKDIFGVPLEVTVQDNKIKTGYGVRWEGAEQDVDYYRKLAKTVGFTIEAQKEQGQVFHLQLKK
ncbi:MAG: class I SAM-dependent methyltransferase [Candidatus Methanofastidiosia archaeon]|jgi:ubiquinone/menaquinone biosynthesis C-methylase UbiE